MLPAHHTISHLKIGCRHHFRKPLRFIVIAVMSVMRGTLPDTYGVFCVTINSWRVRGPSRHRHGYHHRGNRAGKLFLRSYDGDDAHVDESQACFRCPLGLPPQRAIFDHLLESQTRSWFWPTVPVLSAVNTVLS